MSAWTTLYHKGLSRVLPDPVAYGILAIKRELVYLGYNNPTMNLDVPTFGSGAVANVKKFQEDHAADGLVVSGTVGPSTARVLFRHRATIACRVRDIPQRLLNRVKTLESANDPAAVGYADPDDHGLLQINGPSHPDVTLEQAFDPAFSIPWGGDYLADAFAAIGDWDGAIASFNTGRFYARKWVAAGKPDHGLVVGTIDWYARAFHYVALVHEQTP